MVGFGELLEALRKVGGLIGNAPVKVKTVEDDVERVVSHVNVKIPIEGGDVEVHFVHAPAEAPAPAGEG